MLTSFMIYIRPLQLTHFNKHVGRWLNGLLFHLIREVDPELATRLHEQMNLKPFTISELSGNFHTIQGKRCALPDEIYQVRYTVLMNEIFEALGQVLLERYLESRTLMIHDQPFELLRIGVAPYERNPWVATTSYAELYQQRQAKGDMTLQFVSPTASKNGDMIFLFPLPTTVFGSLRRSWQAFSDIPLSAGLMEFVQQCVVVSRYALSTRVISAGRYKLLGFVGECSYQILDQDSPFTSELNMLADFALFSGIGMKTTQGMGQARRI